VFLINMNTTNQDGREQEVMNGTASIKFTAATVREVAGRAKEFTDGRFALQTTGSDLGNGTRFFDAHTMTVWFGPTGARRACAYYYGGMLGTAQAEGRLISDEDTAYLLRVQAAYLEGSQAHKDDMLGWEEQGRERARLMAEVAKDAK
jgi:hypothetical protein